MCLCFYCRYNKQVLKVFPYPVTCTTVQVWQNDQLLLYFWFASLRLTRHCANLQFAVGSLFAVFMWTVGLLRKPEFSKDMVSAFDHGATVS